MASSHFGLCHGIWFFNVDCMWVFFRSQNFKFYALFEIHGGVHGIWLSEFWSVDLWLPYVEFCIWIRPKYRFQMAEDSQKHVHSFDWFVFRVQTRDQRPLFGSNFKCHWPWFPLYTAWAVWQCTHTNCMRFISDLWCKNVKINSNPVLRSPYYFLPFIKYQIQKFHEQHIRIARANLELLCSSVNMKLPLTGFQLASPSPPVCMED